MTTSQTVLDRILQSCWTLGLFQCGDGKIDLGCLLQERDGSSHLKEYELNCQEHTSTGISDA